MHEEIIEVVVGRDGKVQINVQGVEGPTCVDQTAELIDLLGSEVESQELTNDYYIEAQEEQEDHLWH